jgi:alginate O-acetyltransferase complex protein AlgI
MLFNSPVFIFGFLPITLLGFFLAARIGSQLALAWLTAASLFFYGWWNPAWVPLLLASIALNFFVGREIARRIVEPNVTDTAWLNAKSLLVFAVGTNLVVLIYYKYAVFFAENAASLAGLSLKLKPNELPLGISFFTFTQIAFLVDVYRRKAADFSVVRYGLFVTYFPHLIAGPILHHAEMMPQFARDDIFRFNANRLADGLCIFMLGLFKKTVLADQFGTYASIGFNAAGTHSLSFYEGWGAALSYTMQIYFDFSGYSDMAIGLGMMIGVQLPLNFHSPYKSLNITEFWRRWHMTLSRFLRDYLYIPLGGNRKGEARRYLNLMITMLLGGLWHGAGWTFVLWGALHGALLATNGAWIQISAPWRGRMPSFLSAPLRGLSWGLTFVAVVVGWVFFRASDLHSALSILESMTGQHGAYLPIQLFSLAPWLTHIAQASASVPHLADGTVMGFIELSAMLSLGMALVVATPSMHELRAWHRYALLIPCAALALQRVFFGASSEFLYFQF